MGSRRLREGLDLCVFAVTGGMELLIQAICTAFCRNIECSYADRARFSLQVLMAAGDHAGLIEACARLGDVSRGGDPHLWTEVLQYFGSQQYDCSVQVIRHSP